jgi:hypothetical protein
MDIADSTINRLIQHPYNEAICRYILADKPSAHSDLTEELDKISATLPAHKSYCPNPARYAYVILLTNSDKIFAAACGMSTLLFNLPVEEFAQACTDGGGSFADLPDEWVGFEAFRTGRSLTANRKRLRHWCQIAFVKASTDGNDDEKSVIGKEKGV